MLATLFGKTSLFTVAKCEIKISDGRTYLSYLLNLGQNLQYCFDLDAIYN